MVEKHKEYGSDGPESSEMPAARAEKPEDTEPEDGRNHGHAGDKQANPSSGDGWAEILGKKSGAEDRDSVKLESRQKLPEVIPVFSVREDLAGGARHSQSQGKPRERDVAVGKEMELVHTEKEIEGLGLPIDRESDAISKNPVQGEERGRSAQRQREFSPTR